MAELVERQPSGDRGGPGALDIRKWLEDNGLGADDGTGMPPGLWAHEPPARAYRGCTFDPVIRRYRRGAKVVPTVLDPDFRP